MKGKSKSVWLWNKNKSKYYSDNNKQWTSRVIQSCLDFSETFYRQPTLWLHDLCLENLTVHGNEFHLFFGQGISPQIYHFCCTPDIASIGTIFKTFSYDSVSDLDSKPSPSQQRMNTLRDTPQSRVNSRVPTLLYKKGLVQIR